MWPNLLNFSSPTKLCRHTIILQEVLVYSYLDFTVVSITSSRMSIQVDEEKFLCNYYFI
jgi:hypothetical protein